MSQSTNNIPDWREYPKCLLNFDVTGTNGDAIISRINALSPSLFETNRTSVEVHRTGSPIRALTNETEIANYIEENRNHQQSVPSLEQTIIL
jgi:hypothetical protein